MPSLSHPGLCFFLQEKKYFQLDVVGGLANEVKCERLEEQCGVQIKTGDAGVPVETKPNVK